MAQPAPLKLKLADFAANVGFIAMAITRRQNGKRTTDVVALNDLLLVDDIDLGLWVMRMMMRMMAALCSCGRWSAY